jgi:AbrB family looped-hinge helix DNA binding protein
MALRYHLNTMASPAATVSWSPQEHDGRGVTAMSTVRIDAQGRIVVPLAQRERLGIRGGDELALIPTPEGLILERRRAATVATAPDGLPIVEFTEPRPVPNDEALEAIRAQRDAR